MPEPNKPITNPVLVDAMAIFKLDVAKKETNETFREHERAFLQAAIDARYLLPAQIEQVASPEQDGDQQQARIAFQIMTNPQGDKFLPAFTDNIEIMKNRKPDEKFQVAVMKFMDLYHFMKKNEAISGVVINPFGSALCLIRQQIIAIGDNGGQVVRMNPSVSSGEAGAAQEPQQRPDNALGAAVNSADKQQEAIRQAMAEMEAAKAAQETAEEETDPVTDDLLNALKGVLKKYKAVKKAYIRPESDKGERYLLIALEADENTNIEEIGIAVSEGCGDYSDLALECVSAGSIRAKELIAEEKPFYEKKRFGIF